MELAAYITKSASLLVDHAEYKHPDLQMLFSISPPENRFELYFAACMIEQSLSMVSTGTSVDALTLPVLD